MAAADGAGLGASIVLVLVLVLEILTVAASKRSALQAAQSIHSVALTLTSSPSPSTGADY